MDILKCYRRSAEQEPFALRIEDSGEEYDIVIENLHSSMFLDTLIQSGWTLAGLPYDLRKGGMRMSELPQEIWVPAPDEEQGLYDTRAAVLPMESLLKRVKASGADEAPKYKTNYRIMTRQEFIDFIESPEFGGDADFLPLNYFVHPNARFSLNEYCESMGYGVKINNRRIMSETRFNALVNWAISEGLPADFKPLDLVEFYFRYGLDGVRTEITAGYREIVTNDIGSLNDNVKYESLARGLIDGDGIIECSEKGFAPKCTQESINRLKERIPDGCCAAVALTKAVAREVIYYGTGPGSDRGTVRCDEHTCTITLDSTCESTTRVSLRCAGTVPAFWNPAHHSDTLSLKYIYALADEVKRRKTVLADVSSYRALAESGFSPKTAVRYYSKQEQSSALDTDDDKGDKVTSITPELIDAYFAGDGAETAQAEEVWAEIEDFINGGINIDNVESGATADAQFDTGQYVLAFLTATEYLGVAPDDIYKAVSEVNENTSELFFEGRGRRLWIELNPIDGKLKGFYEDKRKYENDQAALSSFPCMYVYVTCAACELGVETARRHIGFSAYVLNFPERNSDNFATVFGELRTWLTDMITSNLPPRKSEELLKDMCKHRAAAVFSVALKGKYKFPAPIGEQTAPEGLQQRLKELLGQEYVCGTSEYCDFMYTKDGFLTSYCVNATITPTKITPKKGYSFLEKPLYAIWLDWAGWAKTYGGQTIRKYEQVRKFGSQPVKPWTYLKPILGAHALSEYYHSAQESRIAYPKNLEYIRAHNPYDDEYRLLAGDEEPPKELAVPRTGMPEWALYPPRMLTYEPPADPVRAAAVQFKIRLFEKFDAADYFYCRSEMPELPRSGDKRGRIGVTPDRETFVTADGILHRHADVENLDFTEIAGVKIRAGKYVVLDGKNVLREITV
jgi:hypothetical protein